MKNKLFTFLSLLLLAFGFYSLQVDAAILNESQLIQKTQQVQYLTDYDIMSLINKTELIGYRMEHFRMATSQYQNTVRTTFDVLKSIQSKIQLINMSPDFSDSDKLMQCSNLYQEADAALYNLNTRTMDYLSNIRLSMPSLTYSKFVKKFQELYNSLKLTDTVLMFK